MNAKSKKEWTASIKYTNRKKESLNKILRLMLRVRYLLSRSLKERKRLDRRPKRCLKDSKRERKRY